METTMIFTRKQYLNKECTHEQYYAQFVTNAIRSLVYNWFGIDQLKEAYKVDINFNSIPLAKWDSFLHSIGKHPYNLGVSMKEVGDYLTLAGQVCIVKEAARQLVNQ